jgi:hypothetical protein
MHNNKMKLAQIFYWPVRRRGKKRTFVEAGLAFVPGITLPFGFALVRFKAAPFKQETHKAYELLRQLPPKWTHAWFVFGDKAKLVTNVIEETNHDQQNH